MRNPVPAVVRRVGTRPSLMRFEPVVVRLETAVRRLTRGRRGVLDLAGLPSVEVTAPGRRTGIPRTTALLYVPDADPDVVLLVGSNWGRPKHPAWSANLLVADKAELHRRGDRFPVTVTPLDGPARDAAWQRAVAFWPGYAMEQRMASHRPFRLFELRRSD
ncbi:MAG: nitroreductase family deazaflavin-dependent oxidoreductase [Mycobacteriaceae bacterium]|nr:nitroreductase family deazaflavin-dependent oxidoreductase [Mycobacteriaceae bacterium]